VSSSSVMTKPLARAPYLGIGVALAVLKIALDYLVAHAFDKGYSVLFYVSPMDGPLLRPSDDLRYWETLAAVAVPFVALGVMLTSRRLLDAGLSRWLVLLFFVPFANLLFFLVCVMAPSQSPATTVKLPEQGIYREGAHELSIPATTRSAASAAWMAGLLGAVIGLGAFGVSVGLLREYGAALMLGAPSISGFATGAFYARLQPGGRFRGAALATLISSALTFGVSIVFALDGVVCLLMALPLIIVPAFFCAFIGFEGARVLPARTNVATIAAGILLFPLILGVEHLNPLPPLTPPPVETAVEIDAPPARVWTHVAELEEMDPPKELFFQVGVAYPRRATLEREGVGAVRRCEFNTGTALETVETWAPSKELTFRIDTQPDPMREATLWDGPRQPHLDGYVRSVRGQFTLESIPGPLPGGRTRVVGRSWYAVRMTPEWYWRIWSDAVIHAIHGRVLAHVKARAEADARAPVAALP
jgi:uncharacterized membrane protein YhaH (DUF805 family)